MAGRARSQSMSAATMNTKAQLNTAYNELGKELSDSRMRVVGNYNMGRIIGEGSFGKVRLGTHRLTSTRVAIKQIPKAVSAQLTREIHHHRQLHHPHVAQLFEVIATEGNIWLVTELCAGGELFDYLVEKGRIDEYEARIIFGQLCLAVGYVHDRGAVHRDLKLENVLLDEHCRVKLSDFGFTREFEKGTLLDTFCGTIGYASPEMLLGQKYLGQEVDIWSLGIILYALLTGTLPFDDDDEIITKEKILAGMYEDPEWLSSEARDLIQSILVREPSKRLTLTQILAHPWFTVPLHPPTPPPEATSFPEALAEERSESRPPSPDQSAQNVTSTPLSKKGISPQDNETPRPARLPATPPPNPNPNPFSSDGNLNIDTDLSLRPPTERCESYQSNRIPSSGSIPPPLPTRTPARTKRRSVSSTISPPGTPKQRPSSSAALPSTPVPDFLSAMQKSKSADVVFSTPVERELLSVLVALGFDTAQIVHSVLSDACDSAGALWWMLRKKVIANGGLNLPDRNNQGPGLFNPGILADIPIKKKNKEKVPEKEKEERKEGGADTIFTEFVDAKKKKREREKEKDKDREREREGGKDRRDGPPAGLTVMVDSGPNFAIVPPTPARDEMLTGRVTPPGQTLSPTSSRTKSPPPPTFNLSTSTSSKLLHEKDKMANSKPRSGSISIMQRAQTVLGRKKSDEPLREKGSEEARLSTGSVREGGSKLTKSPPPGKRSTASGGGEADAPSSPWVGTPKSVGTPSGSAFSTKTTPVAGTPPLNADGSAPGRRNGNASAPANLLSSPSTSLGGETPRPPFARNLSGSAGSGAVKARNRASLINTFKMWFAPDDGKRKRKVAPNARGVVVLPPGDANPGTIAVSPLPSPFIPPPPSSASSQRNFSSGTHGRKGKGAARRGRGHKDKRPSVSSRRSSSVNSRRSSVASMTPSAKGLAALREHQSESVISASGLMGGMPLTRSRSDASRRSFGAQTPISEGEYEGSGLGHESQSRPSSLKSFGTPAPRRGGRKRHSKSSSASSADQIPTSASRPGSRAGTGSPLGRFHRRAGSGSSQTRVVRQVKPGTKVSKGSTSTGHRRSGSVSSVRSHGSSAAEDVDMEVLLEEAGVVLEEEEPPPRSGTPSGKSKYSNTVLVAQKKHSAYGNPHQSIGRSSWKRAWGVEPPGWSSRAAHVTVIETIILDDRKPGHVRDVFAKGVGQADDGDEDDWEDEDDDVPFAGGVGQPAGLTASNLITANGRGTPVESATAPSPSFGHAVAGRRKVGKVPVASRVNKANGSPVARTAPLPLVTPPSTTLGMEITGVDRMGGRRAQLPQGRSGFKPATVVEEEEEEEEG